MNRARVGALCLFLLGPAVVSHGEAIAFTARPEAKKSGSRTVIQFAVSTTTDVEVAVLAADGKVVRHLAAGVLGATNAPPEPLKPGLAQELTWDGKDDFGQSIPGDRAPFTARVRAGLGVKFGRFIGEEPYNFGAIDGLLADEDGNLYLKGFAGEANQSALNVRVFDAEGRYLREILPFPADLPPDAMKDVARWDDARQAFYPRNYKSLTPEFYVNSRGGNINMVSASRKTGLTFTDGNTLFTIDTRGAVPAAAFASRNLGGVNNVGNGPNFVAISPDGKWAYRAGPFSIKSIYGHAYDTNFPPGRVYRTSLTGAEGTKEFVTIPVAHTDGNGGAWLKSCGAVGHFTAPHGAIHAVAVDAKGNVYVADREHGCVAVFDESGKTIGKVAIKNPHLIAVHPLSGAIYVIQYDCAAYGNFPCTLYKFTNFQEGAQPVATYAVGNAKFPGMALAAGKDKTVVWMAGVPGGLVPLEDKGDKFEPVKISFAAKRSVPADWNRLAVDYDRDEIYISNGVTREWRFNGRTGEGGVLKKDGKEFAINDLAVGYDGLLYVRVSNEQVGKGSEGAYSGPFWRLDRDLNPAPYTATGTHILSPYIYSRFGIGFAERGIGVAPDGKVYLSCMGEFAKYHTIGFDADGKPMKGKYLDGKALLAPIPQGDANIRVDWKGNLYLGVMYRNAPPPRGFEKDQGYRVSVGSVVKFGPDLGTFTPADGGNFAASKVDGARCVYPGLAPFSNNFEGFGGNTCCACRVPRFDLDRYGRLAIPNAITCSVLLYDNAGNLITEFGKYGNFDSQYVNPNREAGKAGGSAGSPQGKPTVAVPDIPLACPTGAGFTENNIYVNDTYNRRVLRLDQVYAAEATCAVK